MPIYEFYCADCHRVFSFLSRRVDTDKRPACPRCGHPELTRRVSAFAISRGRKEPGPSPDLPDMDEARLARAMESLAGEAEHMGDDPRQGAQLMRRLFDAAGMPVGGPIAEALRRMEGGESPEKIEEEMGDVLGDAFPTGTEEPGEPGGAEAPGGRRGGLTRLRRAVLPPSVDPELYEL